MTRRTRRDRPKLPDEPRLTVDGDPFQTGNGEAIIAHVPGFGPRIIKTSRTTEGELIKTPKVSSCIHRRPLVPAPTKYGGLDRAGATRNPEAYAQVCRLCDYEATTILNRREKP